jgi:hypothetical protein
MHQFPTHFVHTKIQYREPPLAASSGSVKAETTTTVEHRMVLQCTGVARWKIATFNSVVYNSYNLIGLVLWQ